MNNYLIKRLLYSIPTIFGILTIVFFLIHLIPGDPIDIMLGENAQIRAKEDLRQNLDLDKPIHIQYYNYFVNIFRGDLGTSIHSKEPVIKILADRLPATIELAFSALLIAVLISIPLGVLSAVNKDSLIDRISMIFAVIGVSMPNFWLGPLLIILFSINLGILPVSGRGDITYLILPTITLGTGLASILTRLTRSSMLDVLKSEYILTAQAKGLKKNTVIFKHALSNALLPIITILGLQMGSLLAGSIITETIFSWPGIGRLAIQSINTRDYPVVQGCILLIALSYSLINILIDILYSYIDPRIRLK